jgi:hypothetical protein
MKTMFAHANLIITAWDGDLLVGVAVDLDWVWTSVSRRPRRARFVSEAGIGKELMRRTPTPRRQAAAPRRTRGRGLRARRLHEFAGHLVAAAARKDRI